jgi:hypothetical protein
LWNSNALLGATPDPLPHLTVTPYYSNVYNNNRINTTLFSSKADIDTVYRPIVFNAGVDLSNETAVKNFVETNGTIKTGFTTVAKNNIGVYDEEATHAYTSMMLLGENEVPELSVRDVDWTTVTPEVILSQTGTIGQYGTSCVLSADGKTMLVSGHVDIRGSNGGCAFVWEYDEATSAWGKYNTGDTFTTGVPHDLSLDNTVAAAAYGLACDISADGKTVVVSGYVDASPYGGIAWVWTYDNSTKSWSNTNGDLSMLGVSGVYYYGMDCAISGNGKTILVIRNSTTAYFWTLNDTTGTWEVTEVSFSRVNSYWTRACALSVDGNTALITASGPNSDWDKGDAWIFTRDGATWTETGNLHKANGTVGRYGTNCALSGDGKTALISAFKEAGSDSSNQGSAFIWKYNESSATW